MKLSFFNLTLKRCDLLSWIHAAWQAAFPRRFNWDRETQSFIAGFQPSINERQERELLAVRQASGV